MSDTLYIANAALDLVGQGQIASLDDDTPSAKKCLLHMGPAVREVLGLTKFKCAQKQSVLSLLTGAPTFQWTYAYQLPNDYLRMVMVLKLQITGSNYCTTEIPTYEIMGKMLLTNQTTVQLIYIADHSMAPNDMSAISQPIIELITVKLAQKMAWSFQQSRTLKESLDQEYLLRRRVAMAQDAQETKAPLQNPIAGSNWLRDRVASTAG